MPSYLVIKALHLIAMVAWFAGLFYVFRLFVYHRARSTDGPVANLLSLMEGKLLRIIIWPASLATLSFGLWLLFLNQALLHQDWLRIKLLFVGVLFGYQFFAQFTWGKFRRGEFFLTERQCRMVNEFPTLILFAVIFLAVLKPIF
jgi:putative membrane protein